MGFIRRTEVIVLTLCVIATAMLYAANIAGAEGSATDGLTTELTSGGTSAVINTVTHTLASVVLTATPDLCDSGTVNLAWIAVPNAEGYRIFRDSTSNQIYQGPNLTHADSGLAVGSNHTYYLQAFKAGFLSSNSSVQATAPIKCPTVIEPYGGDDTTAAGGPTSTTGTGSALPVARNLTAVLNPAQGGVTLTWSADQGSASFGIFRRVLGTDFTGIGSVSAPTYTFTDHQIAAGIQYEYQVRVCVSGGCSTASNIVGISVPAVTAQPAVTSAVTGATATNQTTATATNQTTATATATAATTGNGTTGATAGTVTQSNTTQPKPVVVIAPAVQLVVPKKVESASNLQVYKPEVTTFPAVQTTSARPVSNVRLVTEPITPANVNALAPSQIVASMQSIAETVASSQSAVNAARESLIAAIDAHIDTVTQITTEETLAQHEATIRSIREALVNDIDATIARGNGLSERDTTRIQASIQDGFTAIDRSVSLDSSVPDATRQSVIDSMIALGSASQNAVIALQQSGGADLYKDTNRDGISDYDSVHIYNLDPIKPSPVTVVEGRTLTAGDKVLLGYDPTSNVLMAVPREEPELSLAPETTVYAVAEVKLTPEKRVSISGTALPNSYITLYIYSTPIVVTVKTDSSGKWKYTVDRELETGEHKIYAASVDNTGKIVAKTVAIPFTKTAEAATLDTVPSLGAARVEKPSISNNRAVLPLIAISILFILGTLYVIGKERKTPPSTPASA